MLRILQEMAIITEDTKLIPDLGLNAAHGINTAGQINIQTKVQKKTIAETQIEIKEVSGVLQQKEMNHMNIVIPLLNKVQEMTEVTAIPVVTAMTVMTQMKLLQEMAQVTEASKLRQDLVPNAIDGINTVFLMTIQTQDWMKTIVETQMEKILFGVSQVVTGHFAIPFLEIVEMTQMKVFQEMALITEEIRRKLDKE